MKTNTGFTRFRTGSLLAGTAGLVVVGLMAASPAFARSNSKPPNGQKAAFFMGGNGTAGWVNGNDPLVPSDTDGKVIQLTSPDGSSYGGFVAHAIDGVLFSSISNISYDYVTNQSGGSGGSPRLCIDLSDGVQVQLGPANVTADTWSSETNSSHDWNWGNSDPDVSDGSTLAQEQAAHPGATVMDAFLIDDSGWIAAPFNVQIDNMNLNGTVYTAPATSKH
jgi:hypothetical protein